ncbi:MAG: Rrf2 family transcriptional regulator [Pseudomonas sp.]
MRNDSRLSRMLHVLVHMARHDGPLTSERIAQMLGTHSAVVRRTMAGLRDAGYVRSEKGHGGGWVIACDLEAVTLLDVYRVVGSNTLFAIGNERANPNCVIEQIVNHAIDDALHQAELRLVERLGAISLGELNRTFDERR